MSAARLDGASWSLAKRVARDAGLFRGPVLEYPPALFWRPLSYGFARGVWAAALERRRARPDFPLGVFVNVPFCSAACRYCDYVRAPAGGDFAAYLRAVAADADALGLPAGAPLDSLYVSGGSLADVPPRGLDRLFETLLRRFSPRPRAAIAVGLGHAPLSEDALAALARWGVTKAVLQVQSLDPVVSRAIGRPASREGFARMVDGLRAAGVRAIKVDWMVGLPEQTTESFRADLRALLSREPDEVVATPFHPGTHSPLRALSGAWRPAPIVLSGRAAAARAEMLRLARAALNARQKAAGCARVEPAAERASMVGLGPGAISRAWALARHARAAGGLRGVAMDESREALAFAVRALAETGRLERERLTAVFGHEARPLESPAARALLERGALVEDADGWRVAVASSVYRRVAAAYLYEDALKERVRQRASRRPRDYASVDGDLARLYGEPSREKTS